MLFQQEPHTTYYAISCHLANKEDRKRTQPNLSFLDHNTPNALCSPKELNDSVI